MFILNFLLSVSFADTQVPQSFQHLKPVTSIGGTLYVDSSVKCTPKPISQEGPEVVELCQLDIGGKPMRVEFTEGPSGDPEFFIFSKKGAEPLLSVAATEMYIPKGKNVYSEGWTNSMFNYRRKFTFQSNKFAEVKQPFQYVGIKAKVQKMHQDDGPVLVTLFADKSKKKKVAVLPEGSEIEVLLSDDPKWYLVRSSFGLVGWVEIPEYAMNTNIGLSFAGD